MLGVLLVSVTLTPNECARRVREVYGEWYTLPPVCQENISTRSEHYDAYVRGEEKLALRLCAQGQYVIEDLDDFQRDLKERIRLECTSSATAPSDCSRRVREVYDTWRALPSECKDPVSRTDSKWFHPNAKAQRRRFERLCREIDDTTFVMDELDRLHTSLEHLVLLNCPFLQYDVPYSAPQFEMPSPASPDLRLGDTNERRLRGEWMHVAVLLALLLSSVSLGCQLRQHTRRGSKPFALRIHRKAWHVPPVRVGRDVVAP